MLRVEQKIVTLILRNLNRTQEMLIQKLEKSGTRSLDRGRGNTNEHIGTYISEECVKHVSKPTNQTLIS